MSQITLRGFDKDLEQQIRQLAARERISLNRAVLKLARQGAGLRDAGNEDAAIIGDRLNVFIGSWSMEQARDFERAVSVFESVDSEFWQ